MLEFSPDTPFQFQGAFAIFSLFHFSREEMNIAARKCLQWIAPGGYIFIGTMVAEDFPTEPWMFDDDGECARGIEHTFMGKRIGNLLYTRNGWVNLLRKVGFEVVKADMVPFQAPPEAENPVRSYTINKQKFYTKYETIRKLQIDDYLGLVAMLSSVAQCICTSEQIAHGLGQNQEAIPPSELNRFYIAQYAGNIMYTLAILLTKLSSLCFFICLTGEGSTKQRVVHGSIVCVAAWSFISIIVILLQCHFPDPWIYRAPECIDVEAFWTFNAILDALTQLFVGLLPIYILNGLKIDESKKWLTTLLFSPNLLTLPLLVLRIVYLYDTINSTNYTRDSFNLALVTNLHTSFAVVLSCIPFSKSIVDSLVLEPHAITDTSRSRGTISRYRLNACGRGNKPNTDGTSYFLNDFGAKNVTVDDVMTVPGVKAQELTLNEYLNRAESQERMITDLEPRSPAPSKPE
ncbi:hypothetical protein EYC80_001574 [Monilinia laxa]|uniref:Rhodopsin domain-containing protein n=1 Tax=Monilinia laxa TaxID=61186 RepID=A0A5N6K5C8_MONLA|nr:hypothetical protein EYC80_001574 [Monilinia laxa]